MSIHADNNKHVVAGISIINTAAGEVNSEKGKARDHRVAEKYEIEPQ